jgi:hypothetical protein
MNIAKYQSICFDRYLQRSLFPLDRTFSTSFDRKLTSFGKNPPVLQISYKRMHNFTSDPVWVGETRNGSTVGIVPRQHAGDWKVAKDGRTAVEDWVLCKLQTTTTTTTTTTTLRSSAANSDGINDRNIFSVPINYY